jgi:hypothetical protein
MNSAVANIMWIYLYSKFFYVCVCVYIYIYIYIYIYSLVPYTIVIYFVKSLTFIQN